MERMQLGLPADLTPDEEWFVGQFTDEKVADFLLRDAEQDACVDVRAEVVRALALVSRRPRGVRLVGARVRGGLDFNLCEILGPLSLRQCRFEARIDFSNSLLVHLDLSGSRLHDVDLSGVEVGSDIELHSVRLWGELNLIGAAIGGDVLLSGGHFVASGGESISAHRCRVKGDFICERGFRSEGEVLLLASEIEGDVTFDGAVLSNPGGDAISLDGATIGGGLFCGNGFHSTGEVRLQAAKIGRSFVCIGGSFENGRGSAVSADGAEIGGDVRMGSEFHAVGEVRLLGASVGGDVVFTSGSFDNLGCDAISADRVRIQGDLYCAAPFKAFGEVRLLGAVVAGGVFLGGGLFENPGFDALSAEVIRVGGDLRMGGGFEAKGRVCLTGAHVAGDIDFSGGAFEASATSVDAQRARCGVLRFEGVTRASGGIDLTGTEVGHLHDDPASWAQFSKVVLLDFIYGSVRLEGWTTKKRLVWLGRDPVYRAQPYEHLANTLRHQGDETDARTVRIAKQRARRSHQPIGRRIPEYAFDGLLAYGYKPLQRTVPALLALYLLGALLVLPSARDHGAVIRTRTSPTQAGVIASKSGSARASIHPVAAGRECTDDYPCFSSYAYAADVLIPLVNTHQLDYWTVTSSSREGHLAVTYSRLAALLGWLLTTSAAVGFTSLIRRE